jgi:hypothetical protein
VGDTSAKRTKMAENEMVTMPTRAVRRVTGERR